MIHLFIHPLIHRPHTSSIDTKYVQGLLADNDDVDELVHKELIIYNCERNVTTQKKSNVKKLKYLGESGERLI